jgi:hypothetical protein
VADRVPELYFKIECKGNTRPVFFLELKKCDCEPNSPTCPNTIFSAAGAHEVLSKHNATCTCDLDENIPEICPNLKCSRGTHMVYNPTSKECNCEISCPDIFCISQQEVVYDSRTNICSYQ